LESIDPVWLFGAIALATGVLLGMLIIRLLNPAAGDVDRLKAELEQERAEMERYKASVNSHFNKTSELVNELTQDYVKVYRHLAEGAQTLSDTREFTQVLEQSRGRVLITVEKDVPAEQSAAAVGEAEPAQAGAEPVTAADAPPSATKEDEIAAAAGAGEDLEENETVRRSNPPDELATDAAARGDDTVDDEPPEAPHPAQQAAAADTAETDSAKRA
jgi:uncharacterized membrane-anchored protein YhcB (DUF1043 family)